MVIGEFVLCD